MITVTPTIALPEHEVQIQFILASGPGGQNVNKLATAAQLRFDAANSPSLPEPVRARLLRLAGQRVTREGTIVITARRHRTQARNRADAIERLVALIQRAAEAPRPRRPTVPSAAARRKRLDAKARQAERKRTRKTVLPGDT